MAAMNTPHALNAVPTRNAGTSRSQNFIGLLIVLLSTVPVYAQTGTVMPAPKFTAYDSNGDPVSGGRLCVFEAGSSTLSTSYTTYLLNVANANPVVLDSAGRATVFLTPGQSYKFILKDNTATTCIPDTGTTIWTVDHVSAMPSSTVNLDVQGTAGVAISAGDVVYMSTGAGSLNAGQWYKADADSATTSITAFQVGIAPNAIASGSIGTIRLAGQVTVTGPLTPGTPYYISGTAGGLTATPPLNAFRLGQADSATSLVLGNYRAPVSPRAPPCGRLTLTSGVAVTVSDVTAAGTIYYTPYNGCNQVSLYNGTSWDLLAFTQLSIAVPAPTGTHYDIFLYNNSGVPALELSAAWNNNGPGTGARFAAGTYAVNLPKQDDVFVKSGNGTTIDATRLYLGTFRTTGVANQTEDSFLNRLLWNYYNRRPTGVRAIDPTNSWTYSLAAYRIADTTGVNNLINIVTGVPEDTCHVQVSGSASNDTPGAVNYHYVNIGLNSLTPISGALIDFVPVIDASVWQMTATVDVAPTVPGTNQFWWLERTSAVGTTTWYGDNGAPTLVQSGLSGMCWR